MSADQIQYSEKYFDAIYEYRHVILPPELTKLVPKCHLMSETEWRNLGVQQSPGWVHYMIHAPEPHVILFRRPRTDIPETANNTNSNSNSSMTVNSRAEQSATQSNQMNANNDVSVHG